MTSTREICHHLKALNLINVTDEKIKVAQPKRLGMTNTYSVVSINDQPTYIYRLPGKQWCCGFDRFSEFFNLTIAAKAGINTGIVFFDPFTGIQISTHSEVLDVAHFTQGRNGAHDYRAVDWEYSGNNNRYWDLAFLSVTAKLDLHQDEFLLTAYCRDTVDHEAMLNFYLFKTLVQFTLLVWTASGLGKCHYAVDVTCNDALLAKLNSEKIIFHRFFQRIRMYLLLKY